MAFPYNVHAYDMYYDPVTLSSDPQLSYLLSFQSNSTDQVISDMTEKSIHFNPKEVYNSPLESYNFIDYTKEVYQKLLNQTNEELKHKTNEIVKAIRSGFKEYFLRCSTKTLQACLSYINYDFFAQHDYMLNKNDILELNKCEVKIDNIRGNLPNKWPENLCQFLTQMRKLSPLAFFYQSESIIQQFLIKVKTAIENLLVVLSKTPRRPQHIDIITLQIEALLHVSFKTANYNVILDSLSFLKTVEKSLTIEQNKNLAQTTQKIIAGFIIQIQKIQLKPRLQYLRGICEQGGFGIMKKIHFQKQNYFFNSLATDGQYLYLYISCVNGGMFKIGTGENTIPGKVYLYQPIQNPKVVDQVAWVYLKGKLYLRTSSKQPKNLDIIDPETLKTQGSLQLYCPPLFGHPSVLPINKNDPLLTDGEHLYIIGKRLTTEKLPDLPKIPEAPKKQESSASNPPPLNNVPSNIPVVQQIPGVQQVSQIFPVQNNLLLEPPGNLPQQFQQIMKNLQEASSYGVPSQNINLPPPVRQDQLPQNQKDKKKKQKMVKKKQQKEKKKNATDQIENVFKLVQYVLYEFDVTNSTSNQQSQYEHDSQLVKQLHDSFSAYFTINECRRALNLYKDDLAGAAQWLVDQGEKQRTKRTHTVIRSVVLAQAEVVNDVHNKILKTANQIGTKQDSILHAYQISQCAWTCSKDQVACYTQTGIKIFSKYDKDYKFIHLKQDLTSEDKKYRLMGTYITTVEVEKSRKFNKLPQYLMIYDNYNSKYYTFNWDQQQNHSFPSLVTVSYDYLQYQKRIRRDYQDLKIQLTQVNNITELIFQTLENLSSFEPNRFQLENRPNNWLYIYSSIVLDLNQKISNLKPEETEIKKKLTTKRNKLVAKMNRILDFTKISKTQKDEIAEYKSTARQLKTIYPFCCDGRVDSLRIIQELFSNNQAKQQIYFKLLDIWVMNSQLIIHNKFKYLHELGNRLFQKLKSLKQRQLYDQLLKVLIKGFFIFFPTQDQQYKFIIYLPSLELVDLIRTHFVEGTSVRGGIKQSYIEQITADQVFDKYQNNTNFNNIYYKKSYYDALHINQVNCIGNLLLENIQIATKVNSIREVDILRSNNKSVNKSQKDALLQKILKLICEGNEDIVELYKFLLIKAIKYLKYNISQKSEQLLMTILVSDTLKLLEQALIKLPMKNHGSIIRLMQFILQIYFASTCVLYASQQLLNTIQSSLQTLLRPDIIPLLNSVHLYKFQGISQTLQKTFQTNHPYERGRAQSFETQNFLQSIFITVQFDKRCASDPNHDVLNIKSWIPSNILSGQNSPIQVDGNSNDSFNTSLRMSGKINCKKPYLMLGSSISMEFSSSGHAKDSHSLNRFGFKFGLRPAYSGKIQYEKSDLQQIQNKFINKQNFQVYVNLIKMLIVTASTIIENKVIEKSLPNEDQLVPFLDGKIFSQGLEEQIQNKNLNVNEQRYQIIKEYMSKQHKDKYNIIQKQILSQSVYNKEQVKLQEKKPITEDYWDLRGIPTHIKSYIQQIKIFKGNFIDLFMEARSQVRDTGNYSTQVRRKTFTAQYKKLWLKGQALLFLTVLKHSGLLQLSLKFSIEYIKQNLQAFQEARNSTLNSFVSRMQLERQWQDLLNTYHSKGAQNIDQEKPIQEVKKKQDVVYKKAGKKITLKIQQKPEKLIAKKQEKQVKKVAFNPQVFIRQRLTESYHVKSLCKLKKIPVTQDNYVNVTQIINRLKIQKQSSTSVYQAPAIHLIKSCLFLLRLKSSNNHQQPIPNLKPLIINRSLSDSPGQRYIDKNKVVLFRQWLENWKKWKGFKKEERVQMKFPVKQIVQYIIAWKDQKQVEALIIERNKRVARRVEMINDLITTTKIVAGTLLEKYIFGITSSHFINGIKFKSEGISEQLRKNLDSSYNQYQQLLKSIFNDRFKKLPLNLSVFQNQLSKINILLPKLKSNQTHNLLLYCDMESPQLNMALYYISFKYLSSSNEELIQLSNRLTYKAMLTTYPISYVIQVLWKQLGKDTICIKRWKDLIFQERLLFILFIAEKTIRTQNIDFDEKKSLAEVLFHIAYHIQSPLINKITLRLLKLLKLSINQQISTPLEFEYFKIKQIPIQKGFKRLELEKVILPIKNSGFNNWQLLNKRCGQEFLGVAQPIKLLLSEEKIQEKKYHLMLHLSNEQDLVWMVRVLYYAQQLFPTIKAPSTYQEYLQQKNKKQDPNQAKKQSAPTLNSSQIKIQEKIFNNIPENIVLDQKLEQQLPTGWFINYNNCYQSLRSTKIENYKRGSNRLNNNRNKNNQKKNWTSPNLQKLTKKYQQLWNKPIQEPKQADSLEDKLQFVKAKNFIARLRKHCSDINSLYMNLFSNGYAILGQYLSEEKARVIRELFELGKQNKLNPIQCDLTKKDYKTKLTPGEVVTSFNSELRLSVIDSNFYPSFQLMVDYTAENAGRQTFYSESNKVEVVLDDCQQLYWGDANQPDEAEGQHMKLGKQLISTGWYKQKRRMQQVSIKGYQQNQYSIVQGGLQTGIKQCAVISNTDTTFIVQQIQLQNVTPKLNEPNVYDQDELIAQIKSILRKQLPKINNIKDLQEYLRLRCLLEKVNRLEWQYYEDTDSIKEIARALTQITKKITPKKTAKQYEQQLQKLMIRLSDKNSPGLEVITFEQKSFPIDPRYEKFVIANVQTKQDIKLEHKSENISSHMLPASSYLASIESQPPQIQQNKLLKYWQKNIIPRIYDFVKTTLKEFQINQFFEQMRIPLRKNDQNQASKAAYIICDNKLPPGAVLPDANHDWSTVSIEQLYVGRYALLKIPKTLAESTTPFFQSKNPQELALVQIIFVDTKNNCILVRHRLQTHGLVHYFWASVTSIIHVQSPISKMSQSEIYRNVEECLNGLLYGYSKNVLTKFKSVIEVDTIGFIRENIINRFVKDPVDGWLYDTKEWPIQQTLENLLESNNLEILDIIENQLKPIKSYDTDLFSNQIKKLNVFPSITSLVISFKRSSKLGICSGVKFYNDELSLNQLAHIYTGKNERSTFEPLIFNQPNVYSKYYTNVDNLPSYEQNNSTSKLDVTVFGIEPIWTVAGYLCEKISEIAHKNFKYIDILTRLNKIMTNWLLNPGCLVLKGIAARLVIRITKRLIHIAKHTKVTLTPELLGVDKQKMEKFIALVKQINEQQSKQVVVLYSKFLQVTCEMIAILLAPITFKTKLQIPPFIKNIISTANFNAFIRKEQSTIELPVNYDQQWQRFMVVEGLPKQIPQNQVKAKIIEIINQNKGRILTPALDIYYQTGTAVVLVDGWNVLQLVQEQVIQKIEKQEQKEPEQQEGLMQQWQCGVCTVFNNPANTICDVCGAAAPVTKPKQVLQKVQSADLQAAQRKLKQKQQKRFDNVKQKVKQYVENYWKILIQKIKKQNLLIEEKIKAKAEQKRRRQQKEANKKKKKKEQKKQIIPQQVITLLEIPQQQPCTITVGSQVLKFPIIQKFLGKRLQPSPEFNSVLQSIPETITSNLQKCKYLIGKGYDLWGVQINNPAANLLSYDLLITLMNYVQTQICKQTSSVLSYNPNSIRLISQCHQLKNSSNEKPINYIVENDTGIMVKYKKLAECKPYDIRYSWEVIKSYNNALSHAMPYIQMSNCKQSQFQKATLNKLKVHSTLGQEVSSIRELIMCKIKFQLSQKILQKTSVIRDLVPKLVIQRLKIKEGQKKGIISGKQSDQSILTKAYEQVKTLSATQLRPSKPGGGDPYLSFQVQFKGQNVQGQAGPYRQFFTDVSAELHPSRQLKLLISTPNNLHKSGEGRSKYMINPNASNNYQLNLFEFIGMLMGCSIRTGAHLALDIPKIVWKQLVSQNITISDLEQVDYQFCEMIKHIADCPSEQMFQQIDQSGEPLYWVATLSDGTEQEIIKNSKTTKVEYKDRHKYINKLIQTRIKESQLQINRIRKGISQLIPEPYLNCLSGEDLEVLVCGRPQVDVDLLKKHTKYSGGLTQQSPRIKFFWEVLHQMSEAQRLKFIKFCWGQERLPVNSEEFSRNNIRFMIKPIMIKVTNPDKTLPKADTCFFNIELPDYSSKEALRERVMLAINTDSDSMNAQQQNEQNPFLLNQEEDFDNNGREQEE